MCELYVYYYLLIPVFFVNLARTVGFKRRLVTTVDASVINIVSTFRHSLTVVKNCNPIQKNVSLSPARVSQRLVIYTEHELRLGADQYYRALTLWNERDFLTIRRTLNTIDR